MARSLTIRGLLPWYAGNDIPAGHAQQRDLAETLATKTVFFDEGPSLPPAAPELRGSIRRVAPGGALWWCTGVDWTPVAGAGHIPIGGILDWPSDAEPVGPAVWLECLGQTVTRAAYPELFAAWNIAPEVSVATIPDRRGRSPMGAGQGPSLTNRIVGQLVGGESVTLTAEHLPSHNHTASSNVVGNHSHGGVTGDGGAHNHTYTFGAWSAAFGFQAPADDAQLFKMLRAPEFPTGTTSLVGDHTHTIAPNGAHGHTITVNYSPNPTKAVQTTHPTSITRYFVRAR